MQNMPARSNMLYYIENYKSARPRLTRGWRSTLNKEKSSEENDYVVT